MNVRLSVRDTAPRLAAALLAVAAMALTVAVPTRAVAAPTREAGGLCTIRELADPRNALDCAKRLRDSGVQVVTCAQAPTAEGPDTGVVGWFSSRPASSLRDGVTDRYNDFGVGGYRLSLYDMGCLSGAAHPTTTAMNTVASWEFTGAAALIGAGGTLREEAYAPRWTLHFLDGAVTTVVTNTIKYVFTWAGSLTLILLGLWVIWITASSGRLSRAFRDVGWAMLVVVAVAMLLRWPLALPHAADEIGTAGMSVSHTVVGLGPQSIPPDQCHNPAPETCVDHRTAAGRATGVAVDTILYRNWLRATLGSADSTTAVNYGPALYASQTLTWDEQVEIDAHPELRATTLDAKAVQWNTYAAKVKADDPVAYEFLQGKRDGDRAGAGLVALISAALFSLFDIPASLVMFGGFLIIRLLAMCIPGLAAFGIMRPASGPLRSVVNFAFSCIWLTVLLGFLSGLYLSVVSMVLTSTLPLIVQLGMVVVVCGACLLALWLGWKPTRRIRQMVRAQATEPAPSGTGNEKAVTS